MKKTLRLLPPPLFSAPPPPPDSKTSNENKTLQKKQPVAKPDRSLQAREPGAARVPLSDVFTVPKTNSFFGRSWQKTDVVYGLFMLAMHVLCLLAPATYSPAAVAWFFASYFVTGCLGITLSFHRQLSHRAFQTPKWLEYAFAYCGVLAVQGDPIEWASSHRFHHLHCDTPLDPHSPYEGFWWSHAGWLLDHGATMERVGARGNTSDLDAQPFYRWVQKTYALHVAAQFAALWALGGLPAVVWAGALRICWVYHVSLVRGCDGVFPFFSYFCLPRSRAALSLLSFSLSNSPPPPPSSLPSPLSLSISFSFLLFPSLQVTWFVNSVCHVWGSQTYDAGDLSRNNWWVGILAFGEGWHNNHHAFEFSARHGLERFQVDMTWMVIRALEVVGLATNVKLPTERQKARLLIKKSQRGGAAPAAA